MQMLLIFAILKTLGMLTLTGLGIFWLFPQSLAAMRAPLDRYLLAPFAGIAAYTLFFLWAQGLAGLPIRPWSVLAVFLLILVSGLMASWKRRHGSVAAASQSGPLAPEEWNLGDLWVALVLALILGLALWVRLQNALEFPDQLLDADPYRHHIRTLGVLESGHLSPFEPYIIGQVPIFELQGCYLLAAVLAVTGPFSAREIWMWGGPVFGTLSVLGTYLLVKGGLGSLLRSDLQGRRSSLQPERVGVWVGLTAAALLAASPVHILRTNGGFSEGFAIALMGPTLLYYLRAVEHRHRADFLWFGLYFTALALINPVPAVWLVPGLGAHFLYLILRQRSGRTLLGMGLAFAIFAASFILWNQKFLAVPLRVGTIATSEAGSQGIEKNIGYGEDFGDKVRLGWKSFRTEITRNLGLIHFRSPGQHAFFNVFGLVSMKTKRFFDWTLVFLVWVGAILMIRDPAKKRWRFKPVESFFFLSLLTSFLVLLILPFGLVSFTGKYYRYLLPLSFLVAILLAYDIWRLALVWGNHARRVRGLLAAGLLLALALAFEAKTWGHWDVDCSPEEYAAAQWIAEHTPPDAILIANWYTGDFLRSLTQRRILISEYPRIEVREALKRYPLKIPILPNSPGMVWEYVNTHPGTYYLITSKWGPFGKYGSDPHFTRLKSFGTDPKTQTKIFRIDKAR